MQDFSAHIMDIVQNSICADAKRIEIDFEEYISKDVYIITITDNGCGMDDEVLVKVIDPLFTSRTVRKLGLGIPLLKQNAEAAGAYVNIHSKKGIGTTIISVFYRSNINCIPSGDISGVIVLLTVANPNIEFIYKHKTDNGIYVFNSSEIKDFFGNIPLNDPEIVHALWQLIEENINDIK